MTHFNAYAECERSFVWSIDVVFVVVINFNVIYDILFMRVQIMFYSDHFSNGSKYKECFIDMKFFCFRLPVCPFSIFLLNGILTLHTLTHICRNERYRSSLSRYCFYAHFQKKYIVQLSISSMNFIRLFAKTLFTTL